MDTEVFIDGFPILYHLAWEGALDGMLKHGLLSTEALLDLYDIQGERRMKLLEEHRPLPETLCDPVHGTAVIRDTHALDPTQLPDLLTNDMTPQQYRRTLNQRVFFWPTTKRLNKMIAAYPQVPQTVLEIGSRTLLERCRKRVQLSRINSGTIQFNAPPRGNGTFEEFFAYPYGNRNDTPAEVTVMGSISAADIGDMLLNVFHLANGSRTLIWSRP
jgi:hypothetical protein